MLTAHKYSHITCDRAMASVSLSNKDGVFAEVVVISVQMVATVVALGVAVPTWTLRVRCIKAPITIGPAESPAA